MANYLCLDCGKKSPKKKCRSCGSKNMKRYDKNTKIKISPEKSAPETVINSSNAPMIPPPPPEDVLDPSTPAEDDGDGAPVDIYAQIEKEVAKEVMEQAKPGLDAREKCDLVFSSPFIITNFICDQIDKDSQYKELANIWYFEEKEINEIVNYVYAIMETYYPNVIEKISKMDVVFIIFSGIAIFMIFGKKIIKTMKFFKELKEKKENAPEPSTGPGPGIPGNTTAGPDTDAGSPAN